MTEAERKRLEEIAERVGHPGSAVHSLPATAMDMKFLLRVIEGQRLELEALRADERLSWCLDCHGLVDIGYQEAWSCTSCNRTGMEQPAKKGST